MPEHDERPTTHRHDRGTGPGEGGSSATVGVRQAGQSGAREAGTNDTNAGVVDLAGDEEVNNEGTITTPGGSVHPSVGIEDGQARG